MSITVTRDNLISTFLSEWSSTPAFVDNVRGAPDNDPYVMIQLASTLSEQPVLGRDSGETWERDLGDCVISVRVPVNYSGDGLQLAEDAKNILSQRRVDETITGVGNIVNAGISPDERYYGYVVRIPFRTDNLKT
jgi:hypothetical protein